MFAGDPFFYPIIDTGLCADRGLDPLTLAEACIRGGARVLQLRHKRGSDAAFLGLAERVAAAAHERGVCLIVNDRADIARLAGADGVHVGQEDLTVDEVRAIGGPEIVTGLSTHDAAQLDVALATSATYVAVGPVFGTGTKDTGYTARGLALVESAAGRGKPIVVIGGMTRARVASVLEAGAAGIAVISDLLTGDPEARTREFLDAIVARRG